MKKHSSVFMLIARSTLYKLIPIVFGTSIIQAILFFLSLNSSKFISAALEDGSSLYSYWGIEEVISRGFIPVVSGIAFLLLTLSLCLFGMNRGSKESYTLLRLSVSEKRIFVYHTVFSIGAYIIFWAFQLITMFILCNIYCKLLSADTSYISGQTIMLAFYRRLCYHLYS